ncbi:MAG: response regulator [Acidobacteriota bacterium]|nr:response regulator [Acidobacteriota bacterium]
MPEDTNQLVDPIITIFLIEEDDDARPNLKRNLRELGYRVLVAADLEDALEWVSAAPISSDLVLINLVGVSPDEALRAGRKLRSHAKYDGHTPVVVVPEKIPAELEGRDENVDGNDWVCYYEDAEQLRRLLRRLTGKDSAEKPQ